MQNQPYTLQPMNSIMQQFSPSLGQIDEPAPAQQVPDIQNQIIAAQQQVANYQPYGQKHPILAGLANMVNQRAGVNPMYDANGMGYRDNVQLGNLQRQAATLNAIKQAQQEAGTNATHLGEYNHYAHIMGLPDAANNAVIGEKDLTGMQTLLQKYGAPALMAARDKYNQDMMAYQQAQTALAHYNERKRLGLTDLNHEVAPIVPQKPVFSADGINPYLDAGTVAGVTGTADAAANTGEKAAADAAGNATNLKGNETKLAELQAQIQQNNISNGLAQQRISQDDQHFGISSAQKDQELKIQGEKAHSETGSKTQTYLLQDAKSARDTEHKALNTVQDLNKQLVNLVNKVPASQIRTNPAYLQLNNAYRQAQTEYNKAKSVADEKQARADRYVSSQEDQPVSKPVPAQTQPVRQSASQAPVKIRISRAEAIRRGLIK